jgi:signal transduction histidine kinase
MSYGLFPHQDVLPLSRHQYLFLFAQPDSQMLPTFRLSCFFLLSFFLLLTPGIGFGQELEAFHVRNYNNENGLPQNSVKTIISDEYGFIWMATEAGLVRFDGRHFKLFNKINTGVRSSRMVEIRQDLRSLSWYAVVDSWELLKIRGGKVERAKEGMPVVFPLITKLSFESSDWKHGAANKIAVWDSFKVHLSDKYAVVVTGKGEVCWLQDKQMPRCNTLSRVTGQYTTGAIGRQLYFVARNAGSTEAIRLSETENKKVALTGDILNQQNGSSRFLFINEGTGAAFIYAYPSLYLVEAQPGGNLETTLILSGFDFEQNEIRTAHFDRNTGRVFLGSRTRGLYVFTPHLFRAKTYDGKIKKSNVVYEQLAIDDSTILTGKGILVPSGKGAPVLSPFFDVGKDDYGYTLAKTGPDTLLIGNPGSIRLYDTRRRKSLKHWDFPYVFSISEGLHGIYWLATKNNGVFRLNTNLSDARPELIYATPEYVVCVQQESDDVLWAGTEGHLIRINLRSKKTDTFPELSGKVVRGLYLSHPGALWVCTYENGLYLVLGDIVTHFPLDKNEYLRTAHKIQEDKKGFFWVSTNNGLFLMKKQELLEYAVDKKKVPFYIYYNKNSGFLTNEFNGGGPHTGVALANGLFSFSSMNGVVLFNPATIKVELPDGAIVIDKIVADGNEIKVQDTIDLPGATSRLNLYLASSYMGEPDNLHYEYMLQHGEEQTDWIALDNETLSFTSFPVGPNLVTIRKRSGFDRDSFTTTNIVINVPPQWWQTSWFTFLVFIAAGIVVWLVIHIRFKYLQRQNSMLEETVKDRTAELNDVIRTLESSERKLSDELQFHRRLNENITHDIQTPLKYLALSLKQMFASTKADGNPLHQDIEQLHHSVDRIYRFTGSLTGDMKARLNKVNFEMLNLHELVQQKAEIFRQTATKQNVRLVNEIEESLSIKCNVFLVDAIVHNIIDNSLKYIHGGTITVKAKQKANRVLLLVTDTGTGFGEEQLRWYNHYLNRLADKESYHSVGLGYRTIRESLSFMKGKIFIRSRKGRGSAFLIMLPSEEHSS